MTNKIGIFLFVIFNIFLAQSLPGQESVKKWHLNGNMGLYGDFYSINADPGATIKAHRPGSVGRMVVNSTLTYGDFSLPISLMLSVGQHSVILPPFGKRSFLDFIRDPSNRIGIAPRYKLMVLT